MSPLWGIGYLALCAMFFYMCFLRKIVKEQTLKPGEFIWFSDIPINYEGKCKLIHDNYVVWVTKERKFHRLDGPAIIWSDNQKAWYKNNQLHRLDGPAVDNGCPVYYINGVCIPEEVYWNVSMVKNNPKVLLRKLNMITENSNE